MWRRRAVATTGQAEGDAWLDSVIEVLDHNRGLLGELLAKHLPGAVYAPPAAGRAPAGPS